MLDLLGDYVNTNLTILHEFQYYLSNVSNLFQLVHKKNQDHFHDYDTLDGLI